MKHIAYSMVPERTYNRTKKIAWLRVYIDFGGKCFYCSKELPREEMTKDHLTPRCLGGKTVYINLVPSCEPCNKAKGTRPPTEEELKRAERMRKEASDRYAKEGKKIKEFC